MRKKLDHVETHDGASSRQSMDELVHRPPVEPPGFGGPGRGHDGRVERIEVDGQVDVIGNEIDGAAGINAKLPPAGYANDFATLKGLLVEIFGDDAESLPLGKTLDH